MTEPILIVIAAALVVIAVLVVVALGRLSALAAARAEAQREVTELRTRIEVLAAQTIDFERDLNQDLAHARTEQANAAQTARTELGATLAQHAQTTHQQLTSMAGAQNEQLQRFGEGLATLTRTNAESLDTVRRSVEQRLDVLRDENTRKLDEMRATVDEKLQATLEQRLGQSFKLVSDRLEQVHKGLGEMQSLAAGVGDLKKVLVNVKSRGGWG